MGNLFDIESKWRTLSAMPAFRLRPWLRYGLGILLFFPASQFNKALPDFSDPPADLIESRYPKGYFRSPVDVPIRLAGTFGELRSNHFHSGLDFKSRDGRWGEPIRATADGYIHQIKVLERGYGNVLYVRHPNGYTTVYAHLQEFSPEVNAFVKAQQYKKEQFSVILTCSPNQFPVKKGDQIGKMGSTGSSTGAHLHFEIRNTSSQRTLNPQLFGFTINDHVKPDIRDMKMYVLNKDREVLKEYALPIEKKGPGKYGVRGDTVLVAAYRVGFGVKAYDRMDNVRNDNGIYQLTLDMKGQRIYDWKVNELSFGETRYLNAHTDYGAKQRYGAWFHRCFVLPGNRLSLYKSTASMGMVEPHTGKPAEMLLTATDAFGNKSTVRFWVKLAKPVQSVKSPSYNYRFAYNEYKQIQVGALFLAMPKGGLYEDLLFQYKVEPITQENTYSSLHKLHDVQTPVHKRFELRIKPTALPTNLNTKAVIARIEKGRPVNCGGSWKGNAISTRIREFGNYCIMVDNTAPTVTPISFKQDMRGKRKMSFKLRDDFAVGGRARSLRYRGTIDGKWVLFQFDRKSGRLTYIIDDERIGKGKHTLKLVVTDDRKNEAVFERTFIR